ncbi:MAG: hypothetical protein IJP82_00925 [Bacteroidaceae bacterium]|nr:hypothetical protein [Bacteroidaceae bacterium]
MNTTALQSVWQTLLGYDLTAANKRWLADHLYEAVKAENMKARRNAKSWPKLSKADLVISPEVMALVEGVEPLPEDFDVNKVRLEYLMKKYG